MPDAVSTFDEGAIQSNSVIFCSFGQSKNVKSDQMTVKKENKGGDDFAAHRLIH